MRPNNQGTARTQNGRESIQTVKVINNIDGDNQLMFTITNGTGADVLNMVLKYGAEEVIGALQASLTFTGSKFASWIAFQNYYRLVQTVVAGIQIDSDDTDNFNGTLTFTETEPSGEPHNVTIQLNKYKQPLGGGSFANTIFIPATKLTFTMWEALQIKLSKIKNGTYMTYYFNVHGWSKSKELIPLRKSRI